VFGFIKTLKPSAFGELEITDVNRHYLEKGRLSYRELKGYWTHASTLESLAAANRQVRDPAPLFETC
jgi:glucose-1-phosphate thymidylyltransferase